MNIISRYIAKELIKPFFMSLGVIMFLFILNTLMKMVTSLVGKDIDFVIILEFFYLSLGWIIAMAVPMATLVAGLIAYGRLAQDNEFAALQASGVSIIKILLPGLSIGLLLSYGMLVYNDKIFPEMNHRNKILKQSITRKKPLAALEPGIFMSEIPGLKIKAEKVDRKNNMIYKVVILPDAIGSKERVTITAESGQILADLNSNRYIITLFDGEMARLDKQKPGGYSRTIFSKLVKPIEVQGINFQVEDNDYYSDREKGIDSLKAQIKRMKALKAPQSLISQVEVEYHKKYSLSFACVIMMLIAAPLGLMSGRGGMGASAAISLLIFTVYWFFLNTGEDYADSGKLNPFWAMWTVNFLATFIGVILIYKTGKGSKMSFDFVSRWYYAVKKVFLKLKKR